MAKLERGTRRILLIGAVAVAACSSGGALHVDDRVDGAAAGRGALVDGLQQGEWRHFYPDGQLESIGSYRDDERDGAWQHWHPNGARSMSGRYAEGRQVGRWQFWHPNGALMCVGDYVAGREHGEWRFFHDNGQLQQAGCFADGRRVLTWRAHDRDGQLLSEGVYHDDRPVGVWRRRDAGGAERLVEYPSIDGAQHVSERWEGGGVRREGFARDGVAHGAWLTRHRDGGLRCFGVFADGAPCGVWSTFCGDGAPLARGLLDGGRLTGRWLVRGREVELGGRPAPPWNGQWSAAALADEGDPLQVAACWLAEVSGPLPVEGREVTPASPPAPVADESAPIAELEAPTDPGRFTVREREELAMYRRYYRDGFLPRRPSFGKRYGADASTRRLGGGDEDRVEELIGGRLPQTRFPDEHGEAFDLDTLRGKRVLLVVLRGFTSQVCVYCFAQTAELAPFVPRLRELDCELVVLFPGTRSRFDAFQAACADEFGPAGPPYRMLYDPDLELARELRIEGNLARPSSLILDRDGVVRHAYVAESVENVADRPPARWLVERVERLAN